MFPKLGFRFCSFNRGLLFNKQNTTYVPIFDNIIKLLRPFDVEINIEEMLETVKIIAKYSQHTFYKFPFMQKDPQNYKQFCHSVRQIIKQKIPIYPKNLSLFFNVYKYPEQLQLAKLVHTLNIGSSSNSIKLAACLENIQIALSLHNLLEEYQNNKPSIFSIQRILQNKMSDKKLVLAGDYFHSQASVLSANIVNKVEIPLYLSILEEEAAKGVFYQTQLQQSIKDIGPMSIQLENVYQLAYHKYASKFAFSTLLTCIIKNEKFELSDDAFKAGLYLGLCLNFQQQMKDFLINLPLVTNKHLINLAVDKQSDFYGDKITLPLYYFQTKSAETTVLQQLHDHSLKETERAIQTMKEKSKEHFQKIGVEFQLISNLIDHFRLYE